MKLKCIYVRDCGDIFTEGRVYDAEHSGLFTNQFRLTNDKDLTSHVPLNGALWGFQIIQEDYEEPADTQNQAQESSEKPQPKFGEILHIKGHPYVFIRIDSDGDWVVYDETEEVEFCRAETFDEFRPSPHQEQRERILKRWKGKSLEQAHDTEVCIAEMRVSDLIDFVQENILAET